ncbi:hypothetical protein SPI_00024 [Niveomyces insectorum RCEF 264]|uniref:Uncharacterized protein n=1 Tax=Niveomyces insectorum RCEF 264 TaxID=1081102 RepID=A0A167ZRK3_9HYPO|nr:hypothetical protein SPI_00024 [Niveomyces insectorum RCEF 264]
MSDTHVADASDRHNDLQTDDQIDWDEVERNWLKQRAIARAKEDCEMLRQYKEEEALLQAELEEAICQQTRLTETLLQARVLVDEKHADLDWLDDQFNRRKKTITEKRAADDLRVRVWIDNGRKLRQTGRYNDQDEFSTTAESGRAKKSSVLTPGRDNANKATEAWSRAHSPVGHDQNGGRNQCNRSVSIDGIEAAKSGTSFNATSNNHEHVTGTASPSAFHDEIGEQGSVKVVDSGGIVVGVVERIYPENHWIQKLLDRPVLRPVEIRLGRKFTQAHLDAIYGGHDQKKSKWLSIMIQATGHLQERACQTCAKGQGLFSLCIIVGGSDFPRCGNCEWNKQGCHGFSGPAQPVSDGHQQQHGQRLNSVVSPAASHKLNKVTDNHIDTAPKDSHRRPKTIEQRPSTPLQSDASARSDSTPASPLLDEITKKTLVLKDDGMIFLEPNIMYGVPLRKISPDHAYWEPDWKPVEGPIQSKLKEWVDKLNALKAVPDASLTDKDRTAIFQANRQVNRGNASLKFLSNSDFHPYQLAGKQWVTPSLVHYDTLFRMVATLEELAKFRLDVSPLQWLRQRLYEIYAENPSKFKLDRTVAKLYHDPKLKDIRLKNGFGNIGRPSAGGKQRGTGELVAETSGGSAKKPTINKRKGTSTAAESTISTPNKRVFMEANKHGKREGNKQNTHKDQQRRREEIPQHPPGTASTLGASAQQTQRTRSQESIPFAHHPKATDKPESRTDLDNLDFSGYTSTDSLTNDMVVKTDWRVQQVKTTYLTSNPRTTQYWHWVDEKHAYNVSRQASPQEYDPMFEHQVLKETEPITTWGVFKEPIDFHLRLRELTRISYARDCQKIIIGTRQVEGVDRRGDVLAQFKRERTKRRFLAFMRKKGIELVRTNRDAIEKEWDSMQSDVMPGNESD